MQETVRIRTATRADAERLSETMILAFAADSMARWIWPDGQNYICSIKKIFWSFGGLSALNAGTFRMMENFSGYVTWLPPEKHIDEAGLVSILDESVLPSNRSEVDKVFERMAQWHPHEPHWYLPIIAVDPAHQGRGLGAQLMDDGLAICDMDHLVGYLEATSPRSSRLYERFGYRVLDEIQVGKSPPIYPMRREAK